MARMRPLVGLCIAGICAWVWADSSFANRTQESLPNLEVSASTDVEPAAEPVPTPPVSAAPAAIPGSPEATAAIDEIATRIASLNTDYNTGLVDCSTAMAQVDQCVQTLDTQYAGCETMPVWQDCRNQCVEFQSTLPCCEEVIISDVLIGEEIISETICEPIPIDQSCLPPCDQCSLGGFGGGGGGGGGGFGGGLIGTGLGAAALAVGLADDDSSSNNGGYDGT